MMKNNFLLETNLEFYESSAKARRENLFFNKLVLFVQSNAALQCVERGGEKGGSCFGIVHGN